MTAIILTKKAAVMTSTKFTVNKIRKTIVD